MTARVSDSDEACTEEFYAELRARLQYVNRRPLAASCTHIHMERVYTRTEVCPLCYRVPDLGFLYSCTAGNGLPRGLKEVGGNPCISGELVGAETVGGAFKRDFEAVGLSNSVVSQAMRGEYTPNQVNKLVAQKLEVNDQVDEAMQARQANDALARLNVIQKPRNAHQHLDNDGAGSSSEVTRSVGDEAVPILWGVNVDEYMRINTENNRKAQEANSVCTFNACHHCKPYLKDRIYASLDGIVNDPSASLQPFDAVGLPVKNAAILKNIPTKPDSLRWPISPSTDASFGDTGSSKSTPRIKRASVQLATEKRFVNASEQESHPSDAGSELRIDGGLALTEEAVETLTPDIWKKAGPGCPA